MMATLGVGEGDCPFEVLCTTFEETNGHKLSLEEWKHLACQLIPTADADCLVKSIELGEFTLVEATKKMVKEWKSTVKNVPPSDNLLQNLEDSGRADIASPTLTAFMQSCGMLTNADLENLEWQLWSRFLVDSQPFNFPVKCEKPNRICELLDSMIGLWAGNLSIKKGKAAGLNISWDRMPKDLLEEMKVAIEWAHVPLALKRFCQDHDFAYILAFVSDEYSHITHDDLAQLGILVQDGANKRSKRKYSVFVDYFIALVLGKAATLVSLGLPKSFLKDVVALFVSFVYDDIKYLTNGVDVERQFDKITILRYRILNELLSNRQLNPEFVVVLGTHFNGSDHYYKQFGTLTESYDQLHRLIERAFLDKGIIK